MNHGKEMVAVFQVCDEQMAQTVAQAKREIEKEKSFLYFIFAASVLERVF